MRARPGKRRERVNEIGHPDRLDRDVGVAPDLGVDGYEIIVAVVLDPAAGEIDEGLQVGARRRRLVEKVAQSRAQRLAVEIARADDVEAGRLQRLGDEAGVVGGRRQRLIPIGRVADDERDARIGGRDFAPRTATPWPRRRARQRPQERFSILSWPQPRSSLRFLDWRDRLAGQRVRTLSGRRARQANTRIANALAHVRQNEGRPLGRPSHFRLDRALTRSNAPFSRAPPAPRRDGRSGCGTASTTRSRDAPSRRRRSRRGRRRARRRCRP